MKAGYFPGSFIFVLVAQSSMSLSFVFDRNDIVDGGCGGWSSQYCLPILSLYKKVLMWPLVYLHIKHTG